MWTSPTEQHSCRDDNDAHDDRRVIYPWRPKCTLTCQPSWRRTAALGTAFVRPYVAAIKRLKVKFRGSTRSLNSDRLAPKDARQRA